MHQSLHPSIIISTHSTPPTDPHLDLAAPHSSAAADLHRIHNPAAHTSAEVPKAVVQVEEVVEHIHAVNDPVEDSAVALVAVAGHRSGGLARIEFGLEAVRYVGVGRSFVARIAFGWGVVRWVGMAGRRFGCLAGIGFGSLGRRGVVMDLGGGRCLDYNHLGFEVVVFALGSICHLGVIEIVVEEGIGLRSGRKQDDSIGRRVENVVVVKSGIVQSSSWPDTL